MSNRYGEVIAVLIGYDGPIEVGDTLLVHHNVFKKYYDMKGREKSGPCHFRDDIFMVEPDQFFLYKHKDKWIVLRSDDKASVSFFESLNFKIIIADTLEFLDYIQTCNLEASEQAFTFSTKSIFPEYSIPDLSDIPMRSIDAFYLGMPPEWCDIFTGELCKISHFHTIIDSIYSKKIRWLLVSRHVGKLL